MKIWMIRLMLALLLPACVVRGQTGESEKMEPASLAKFAGVWRGQTDDLPVVDIVITDEGGDGTARSDSLSLSRLTGCELAMVV